MRKSVLSYAVAVAVSSFAGSVTLANGVDASYGFRSGGNYDGLQWPDYQLATQQNHNGFPSLSGDQFDTPQDVSFNNYTGNLAFFDRDNLQTRPAGLIANEAWWTNVKTKTWGNNNSMESCTWGIGFWNSDSGFANTVQFDIAVASPIEITTIMNLVVIDPDHDAEGVYIDLENPDSGVTVAVESFTSLNSPFCYAARVFMDMNVIFADKLADNPDLDESNYGIETIHFDLRDFSTPNGLVQVAIDNLVVGNATPKPLLAEPFTTSNGTPSAPDTPVSIVFTSNPPNPPAPNTIYVDPGQVPPGAGFEVTTYYENQYINSSTSAMGGGLPTFNWNAVLTSSTQEGSTEPVAPGENDLGTVNLFSTIQQAAQNMATGVQLTLPDIDELIAPPTTDQSVIHDYTYGENVGEQLGESILQFTMDELNQFGPEGGPPQRYFVNYSHEDYLQWLQQTGSPSFLSDAGYMTIPLTDEFGSVTGYGFDFWVTGFDDRSINFIFSAVAVPEPTVLTMLGALGAFGLRRRR